MRILDRQRYWAFCKAYVVVFISLVGLYIVIDACTNIDEFRKVEEETDRLFRFMGQYYLVRTSLFYDRLCGVITMMAAIFTVTWMQRNNEHLAMLAAGISTQRAIRPVIFSALIVSGLAVLNQELIIPQVAEELQRTPDDDGRRKVRTISRRDVNHVLIRGTAGQASNNYRDTQTTDPFDATFPTNRFGQMLEIRGRQARYIPENVSRSPLRGGWLIWDAKLSPSGAVVDGEVLERLDPSPAAIAATAGLARVHAAALFKALPPPRGKGVGLEGGTYFLRSNLSFAALAQSRQWYQFAPTVELVRALDDSTFDTERNDIAVFLHARMLRPLLSMTLLALSLPLVLGGYGRNMFINLGLALGTSGVFYSVLFVAQWLGNNNLLAPDVAAWAPFGLFATVAAARWGAIRT
jgi:lipopolysaccharide export system permease protein